MTLNNAEERRAWVAFAACGGSDFSDSLAKWADRMLEEYRARLPATPAADGPDWSTAPEWAEWWAQDETAGPLPKQGVWFQQEPTPGDIPGRWTNNEGDNEDRWIEYTGPYVYPGDWLDSKIRRPR